MKAFLKKYFILFFLIINLQMQAQDKTLDSLKLALKNAKDDTTKCFLLTLITDRLDPNEGEIFNEQLLKLTEKKSKTNTPLKNTYRKYFALAKNNMALIAQNQGDPQKAI